MCLNFGRNLWSLDELRDALKRRKESYDDRLTQRYDGIVSESENLNCFFCRSENPERVLAFDETDIKICSTCKKEKALSEFNWHTKAKGKKQSYCKECQVKKNATRKPKTKRADKQATEMLIHESTKTCVCIKCHAEVPKTKHDKHSGYCYRCKRKWAIENKKLKSQIPDGKKQCKICFKIALEDEFPKSRNKRLQCNICLLVVRRANKLKSYHRSKKVNS